MLQLNNSNATPEAMVDETTPKHVAITSLPAIHTAGRSVTCHLALNVTQ